MEAFFNKRAETYDRHMLIDLQLTEFYDAIADIFPEKDEKISLVDLGCGTGLELEQLFIKMPNLFVTGIDLSREMLNQMRAKYANSNLHLICNSYFDIDFGQNKFDYALSTYSLHHFTEEEKMTLYKRVYESLKPNGIYVEGDYICKTPQQQAFFLAEKERLRKETGIVKGFYHYDTPFTVEMHIKLMKSTGFNDVKTVQEWESTSIITAKKVKKL